MDQITLPIIDISGIHNGGTAATTSVANDIRDACSEYGFFYLKGHGVPQALIDDMFAKSRQFFSQPLEQKLKVKVGSTNRGYVPYGTSIQARSSLGEAKANDQFESFMIRRELEPGEPLSDPDDPLHGPNLWPADMPGFKETSMRYHDALLSLSYKFLPIFAIGLGLPEDFFNRFFSKPTESLRLLHYLPSQKNQEEGFGISPHTDYGFLTILAQDTRGGLEVFSRHQNQWISAQPVPGTYVVNIGDTLSRWTNRRYVSTPHRVTRMGANTERYSVPFFFHPSMDAMIEALPGCYDSDSPPMFPKVLFKDYLMERLTATYATARAAD